MSTLPTIPPLPSPWPFPMRAPGPPPELRKGLTIPSEGGGWTVLAAPDLDLDGEAAALSGAFGRGGVRRLGEVVLRPYRRGGLVRHLNARTYASSARFAQEFLVHRALWLAGFPTVEPLGYAVRRRAWGVEGLFLTRHAECAPWPRDWNALSQPTARLRPLIEALCMWGLHSPDLNATNVMITPEGGVLLLDWDRATWDGGELLAKYRDRLVRSLAKLEAPCEIIEDVRGWS